MSPPGSVPGRPPTWPRPSGRSRASGRSCRPLTPRVPDDVVREYRQALSDLQMAYAEAPARQLAGGRAAGAVRTRAGATAGHGGDTAATQDLDAERRRMTEPRAEIGVFGGSGFYSFLEDAEEVAVDTPYGPTSDRFVIGSVGGRRVAFMPRHGRHHHLPPHGIPYRANLWGMRELGVRRVIGPCASGSL